MVHGEKCFLLYRGEQTRYDFPLKENKVLEAALGSHLLLLLIPSWLDSVLYLTNPLTVSQLSGFWVC